MPADDWSDDDFVPVERPSELDARARYEYLLQIIRYWLARRMSFTEIEDTLAAAGVAPAHAEQIVELVIQDLQGRKRAPGAFPDVDIPPAAIEALGFSTRVPTGEPAAESEPVSPELAFTSPSDTTATAMARAQGAARSFALAVALLIGFCVLAAVLFALFA